MGPTGAVTRILQIHPTRRCNLRCLHCYSSSGPDQAEALPIGMVCRAIADAAADGYNVAGFSGGEPLLYPHLRTALETARACGLSTTVTSNGMLLDPRRLSALTGVVDVLAISLDGMPASHDRMRAAAHAFETMRGRLDGVRLAGIPFGFIFTLTQHNLDELEWVAEFAHAQGASLLQIHPLEGEGRARQLSAARPDDIEQAWAFLEAARLEARYEGRLRIHLDLTDRAVLRADPARGFAAAIEDGGAAGFAWRLSPLVIEPDGTVVPVQYGFPRAYALGSLWRDRLPALIAAWRREREAQFRRVCAQVFAEVTAPAELPFVDWYGLLASAAREDRVGV